MKFTDFKKYRIENNYACPHEPDYESIMQDFKDCKPKVKDKKCIKCFHKAEKRKVE